MTPKEHEIRITMWAATKALWPVIAIIFGIFGSIMLVIYGRAEHAVAIAQEVSKTVAADYVCKDDYKYDLDRINRKLDYLIEIHIDGRGK